MLAIYARKSTEVEESKSIKEQVLRGQELAKKLGEEYKVYSDEGVSGTWEIERRPEFQRLMDDIEDGDIDTVYAFHQDRIERSPKTRLIFLDAIRKNNVRLFYDSGEVDMESEEMEMMGDMISAFSKYFARTSRRRAKNSIKRNISEGKAHGIVAYGYKYGKDKMMVVDEEEADVVKLIFELSVSGSGFQTIAKELDRLGVPTRYNKLAEEGIESKGTYIVKELATGEKRERSKKDTKWNASSVRGILHNRNYIGERKVHGIVYECPQIVPKQLFEKVQANLEKNKKERTGKRTRYEYLLQNIMVCGECGHRMHGRSIKNNKQHYHSYRCLDKRTQKAGRRKCTSRDLLQIPIEKLIWERLFLDKNIVNLIRIHFSYARQGNKLERMNERSNEIKTKKREYEKRRENIVKSISEGVLTTEEAKGVMGSIRSKLDDLKAEELQLGVEMNYIVKNEENIKDAEERFELFKEDAPIEEKRKIVETYIKSITSTWERGVYFIKVEFHIDIPFELFVMDTKYNLAVEGRTNTLIPISTEYYKKAKSEEGIRHDVILNRVVMAANEYEYGEQVKLFFPPEFHSLEEEKEHYDKIYKRN